MNDPKNQQKQNKNPSDLIFVPRPRTVPRCPDWPNQIGICGGGGSIMSENYGSAIATTTHSAPMI